MSLTQLRDTLSSVSAAVPVPAPDAATFQRQVGRVRRRRTAGRVAAAVAAVALVASGSTLVLGGHDRQTLPVTPEPPQETSADVPVIVGGHLRTVSSDGVLGPVGPAVASIVGATAHGVVARTDDGTLGRVADGDVDPLVAGPVRTAFIDGRAVVYEDYDGMIRWRDIEPVVASTDSAQTEQGRLMAADDEVTVIATYDRRGLVAHDPSGVHPLSLAPTITTITGVDTAGGIVAVRTDQGVQFAESDGTNLTELPGRAVGSLAPDGRLYAEVAPSGRHVALVDPRVGVAETRLDFSAGAIDQVGWTADGDLLVVIGNTLWRCINASDCQPLVTVTDGSLRLR